MASNAVLGFDLGSTQTRAVLAWEDGKIEKKYIEDITDENRPLNTASLFSSSTLPYDGGEERIYIGKAKRSGREEASAKFFLYVLAGKREIFREQYPNLERLFRERRRLGNLFCTILEDGFKQLLRYVFETIKRVLEEQSPGKEKVRIKTVALTIPSQWDLDFEDVYRRLFLEAFREVFADRPELAADDIRVEFHSEAFSLAHYMFMAMSGSDGQFGPQTRLPPIATIQSKLNAQCLIDLGGHNANSTLTQIIETSDEKGCLSLLGNPSGAGGGSEMWIYHMVNQAVAEYREKYPGATELSHAAREDFKLQITTKIPDVAEDGSLYIICPRPQGGDPEILTLTADMRKEAYKEAFQYVIKMSEDQLVKLAGIKDEWQKKGQDHIAITIVSGGSSQHPDYRTWIIRRCKELGLDPPAFTSGMDLFYGPCRIAVGAAFASLTTTADVASFAANCAFGLQRGTPTEDGNQLKEKSATTIWHHKQKYPATVYATGESAEYRIVCQPVLRTYTDKLDTDLNVATGACYDFLEVGMLVDCYSYRIEFDLDVNKAQVVLTLIGIPASKRNKAKETRHELGPYPVHVQPDSRNLVITGFSQDEIDKSLRNAWDSTREDADASDDEDYDDAGGPSDDDDDDFDGGFDDDVEDDRNSDEEDDPDDSDHPDDSDDSDGSNGEAKRSSTKARTAARDSKSRATASNTVRRASETPARSSPADVEDGAPALDSPAHMQVDSPDQDLTIFVEYDTQEPEPLDQIQEDDTAPDPTPPTQNDVSAPDSPASIESEHPAPGPFVSTQVTSSSSRGPFASKAATRRATENAFRPMKEVFRRADTGSHAGSGAPGGSRDATSGTVPGHVGRDTSSRDGPRSGQTHSARTTAPPFDAADTQGNTGKKRAGSFMEDDARPRKRSNTGGGPSSSLDGGSRQAARPHVPWLGTAARDGESSTAAENRPFPQARNQRRDEFMSRGRQGTSNDRTPTSSGPWELSRPSRRAPTNQSFTFSDRHRADEPTPSNRGLWSQNAPPRRAPTLRWFSDRHREGNRGPAPGHTSAVDNAAPPRSLFPPRPRGPREGNSAPRRESSDDVDSLSSFGELSVSGDRRPDFGSRPARGPGNATSWSESAAADRAPYGSSNPGTSRPDTLPHSARRGRRGHLGDRRCDRWGGDSYRPHNPPRGPRPGERGQVPDERR